MTAFSGAQELLGDKLWRLFWSPETRLRHCPVPLSGQWACWALGQLYQTVLSPVRVPFSFPLR